MMEERSLAKKHGYESPIWDSLEETHKCYNDAAKLIIENLDGRGMITIASHNFDTVQLAKELIFQNNITQDRVRFGQLKGFSD
jgi:proline dehydrogenase